MMEPTGYVANCELGGAELVVTARDSLGTGEREEETIAEIREVVEVVAPG